MGTLGLRRRAEKALVSVVLVQANQFGKVFTDAPGDRSIAVQFRCSKQRFQNRLLLAHDSLRLVDVLPRARAGGRSQFKRENFRANGEPAARTAENFSQTIQVWILAAEMDWRRDSPKNKGHRNVLLLASRGCRGRGGI
jgi:hypothetical protein